VALVPAALVAAGCGSSEDEDPGIPQSGERITTTSAPTTTADASGAATTEVGQEDTTTTGG
jgi:hypothetical protein